MELNKEYELCILSLAKRQLIKHYSCKTEFIDGKLLEYINQKNEELRNELDKV